jgi:glycosyltransferase involved in cell wall biosynthesis
MAPRFSVVIPTRERADTLRWSLQTCLDQDFDDFEVVVCDNHSSPATREAVEEAASPRVRYVRAPRPLAMSANWELAVGSARGEYLTVLGDDDGLLPFALREADALIHRHNALAVQWHRGMYTWPTLAVSAEANLLRLPLYRSVRQCDSVAEIATVGAFAANWDGLPMLYNSFIHRGVIERHRERAGRVFLNAYPDVYSGFGLGYLAGSYLSVGTPLGLAGLSRRSNGMATLIVNAQNPIAEEFFRLNRADGYGPHPTVPDLPLWPVPPADSFQFAKDLLFPEDGRLVIDRRKLARSCMEMLPLTDPDARARARRVIRDSLADQPGLQEWFDAEVPDPPPFQPNLFGSIRLGFDGDWLSLRTDALGVRNISDAVKLVAGLLGNPAGGIEYNLPPRHELTAQSRAYEADLEQARRDRAALEERLRDTERQAALRYVPRRVARKFVGLFDSLCRRGSA